MEKTEYDWLCELKKSPIFNMSLSSKELFHSNFIAWVLETYPEEMAKFFSEKLKLSNVDEITEIQREKQNIDISFKLGNNLVLIENKVKSIANIEQLQKYTDKFENEVNKELVLLSLKDSKISDEELKNIFWKKLSYKDLLEAFGRLGFQNKYHESLITDYVSFVKAIKNNIVNKIDIEKEVQISELFIKDTNEHKYLESLREIKMHDIFFKGLYEDFARAIYDELSKLDKLKIKVEYLAVPSKERNISVYHGFTNSSGLVDIKYRVNDNFYIGIQIQGNQYRHFVELFDNSKKDICNLLKSISDENLWFSFGAYIHKDKIYPHESSKKCKLYNQFKGKNSIFKYKYFKIDGMTNDNVIERVKNDIQNLVDKIDEIEKIYNKVGK